MRAIRTLMILFAVGVFVVLGIAAVGALWAIATPGQVIPGTEIWVELPHPPHVVVPQFGPSATWMQLIFTLVPLMFVGLIFIVSIAVALRIVGHRPRQAKAPEAIEETRLIQEIYHGLSRMEQRVEALETLLLDRAVPPEHKPEPGRRHSGVR